MEEKIKSAHFYLPPLSYFEFKNVYTGSYCSLRYKITPGDELLLQLWHGNLCSDKVEIEETLHFPFKENSLWEILQVLEDKIKTK